MRAPMRTLCVVCLFLVSLVAHAQRSPGRPAYDAFLAKDYAGFLQHLPEEIAYCSREPSLPFDDVTRVAVALEKEYGDRNTGTGYVLPDVRQ
jgi:hypothetical protein